VAALLQGRMLFLGKTDPASKRDAAPYKLCAKTFGSPTFLSVAIFPFRSLSSKIGCFLLCSELRFMRKAGSLSNACEQRQLKVEGALGTLLIA
jgi:hypothetical protein